MAEIDDFANELNTYLVNRYKYKRNICFADPSSRIIDVSKAKVRLYIRFKPKYSRFEDNSLIIASIGFKKTGKGEGTALLKFLVNVADKYNIEHIAFEQVKTEYSINFTKKFGFYSTIGGKPLITAGRNFDVVVDDMQRSLDVKTLRKNLNAILGKNVE